MQRSLFPDGYEVQADALEALEALDVARGRACLAEARARVPELGNLDVFEGALDWLGGVLGCRPAGAEAAARAFLALPAAGLEEAAARFVDRALARFGQRVARGPFLDEARRVPRAVLGLVLGQVSGLRSELAGLVRREPRRADLCGWLALACARDGRADEANAEFVRALLLDAGAVDLFRLEDARLTTLVAELRASEPEPRARELILVHAWLRGLLTIPPENGWLDEELSTLRARAAHPGDPTSRARAFALLLYMDRSRRPVAVDENEREHMQALEPELFRRYMAVLATRGK